MPKSSNDKVPRVTITTTKDLTGVTACFCGEDWLTPICRSPADLLSLMEASSLLNLSSPTAMSSLPAKSAGIMRHQKRLRKSRMLSPSSPYPVSINAKTPTSATSQAKLLLDAMVFEVAQSIGPPSATVASPWIVESSPPFWIINQEPQHEAIASPSPPPTLAPPTPQKVKVIDMEVDGQAPKSPSAEIIIISSSGSSAAASQDTQRVSRHKRSFSASLQGRKHDSLTTSPALSRRSSFPGFIKDSFKKDAAKSAAGPRKRNSMSSFTPPPPPATNSSSSDAAVEAPKTAEAPWNRSRSGTPETEEQLSFFRAMSLRRRESLNWKTVSTADNSPRNSFESGDEGASVAPRLLTLRRQSQNTASIVDISGPVGIAPWTEARGWTVPADTLSHRGKRLQQTSAAAAAAVTFSTPLPAVRRTPTVPMRRRHALATDDGRQDPATCGCCASGGKLHTVPVDSKAKKALAVKCMLPDNEMITLKVSVHTKNATSLAEFKRRVEDKTMREWGRVRGFVYRDCDGCKVSVHDDDDWEAFVSECDDRWRVKIVFQY